MQTTHDYAYQDNAATRDAPWLKWLLLTLAGAFMVGMLGVPLFAVFYEALKGGWEVYVASLVEPEAVAAIKLTLLTAAIVLPINLIMGVAIGW